MTFKEFQGQYDKYLAYIKWSTISDAKADGRIPEKFHRFFSDLCECGSEIIISPNLHRCMCCDPRCRIKEACRLAEFLKRSEINGFGEKNCRKILDAFAKEDARIRQDVSKQPLFMYGRYLEVLGIPFSSYPLGLQQVSIGYEFYQSCCQLRSRTITFPQLISSLGIAAIGKDALNLFHGINSFEALLAAVKESGGLRNYCIERGFYSAELMDSLYDSMLDIGIASNLLCGAIRREGLQRVNICITGNVRLNGERMTKAALVNELNKMCVDRDGVPLYEFQVTAAVQSVPFIVYSTVSNSAKFLAGKRRGSVTDVFGTHEVLITADRLAELLGNMMKQWNRSVPAKSRF